MSLMDEECKECGILTAHLNTELARLRTVEKDALQCAETFVKNEVKLNKKIAQLRDKVKELEAENEELKKQIINLTGQCDHTDLIWPSEGI